MKMFAKATVAVAAMASLVCPAVAAESGWWNQSESAIKAALKRQSLGGADRMRAFALCSVQRNPAAVEKLLATPQESLEERAASRRLTQLNFDCMPQGDFTLGGMSVRGSLAEAMFWTAYTNADINKLAVRSDETGVKERFADCAVDGELELVRTLIGTAPKSDAESAALAPLMPRLRDCIAKTNFSSMDNASARSLMAEALYRAAKRGGAS